MVQFAVHEAVVNNKKKRKYFYFKTAQIMKGKFNFVKNNKIDKFFITLAKASRKKESQQEA